MLTHSATGGTFFGEFFDSFRNLWFRQKSQSAEALAQAETKNNAQ